MVRNAAGGSTTRFSGTILRNAPIPQIPLVVNLGDVRRAKWSDKTETKRATEVERVAPCADRDSEAFFDEIV